MAEVAYLIGAGASAECIPIVKNMAEAIGELLAEIRLITAKYSNSKTGDDRSRFNAHVQYCEGVLKNLQRICTEFFSIDTYAKMLYLTDKDKFEKLKNDLCFYFSLIQQFRARDKRYDNFFASIINDFGRLPPRVKIISWNYDYQLELSHINFSVEKKLSASRNNLNLFSPANFRDFEAVLNQFSVIKLNGSASLRKGNAPKYLGEDLVSSIEANVVDLYIEFSTLMNSNEPIETDLKFAWESKGFKSMFEIYGKELKKIETLVVIGYSFPYFNRTIDMALFSEMKKLKNIYIQDLEPSNIKEIMVEFVDTKAGTKNEINFISKSNLSQFVFPRELDVTGPEGHTLQEITR